MMSHHRKISVFSLAMICVAAIVTLQNFPLLAEYGFSLVFYLIVGTAIFFVPTALVSAELATGWPKRGGVYIWVKEALGSNWGFLAIWLQWIENVVWYPTVMSFIAATIAYIFNPALANHKIYTFCVILISFWGITAINFLGMRLSSIISSISVLFGTILPGALIIGLAVLWILSGNPSQIAFTWNSFIPDFSKVDHVVFLVGVLFSLAGMEMSAVHAEDVHNPQKNYPRAILLSAIIIVTLSILGSLSLAIVVPQKQISLVAGVMEAFDAFFTAYHLSFLTPCIAFLTAVGAVGMVSTWIVGPSRGLQAGGKDAGLPLILQKMNQKHMPVPLLLLQGGIVTVLSSLFLFMPTVSSSYWILTALTSQLYLLMYILMFISAIVLRYKKPNVMRLYRIPGGNWGIWLTGSVGILSSLFCIAIGFIPPSSFPKDRTIEYVGFLVFGIMIMCAIPLIFTYYKKNNKSSP